MSKVESCDSFNHEWKEEYYGYRCVRCDMFYAFGQAPWEESDDDDYDDDFGDDESSDYSPACPDCWHKEEYCECGELPPEARHDDDCPCPCCLEHKRDVSQQNTID